MKYYIIAGEASGDLHASNLIRNLKKLDPTATFRGWGGDLMQEAGGELVKHYKEAAFMGYWKVIKNLLSIIKNIKLCQQDILRWNPDTIILVDYPGFNLKIAKFAKKRGFRVVYYIPPKLWAWKKGRLKTLKKYTDSILSILPFEEEFFRNNGCKVRYVGNPTLDSLEATLRRDQAREEFITQHNLSGKPIIALLPGSRTQEIRMLLPVMLSITEFFPDYEFVVSGAPGQDKELYDTYLKGKNVKLIFNNTYQLLLHSQAAIVASGTATLETALIGVPQVVCYKMGGGYLTYGIGRLILKSIKYISLVNLILDAPAVTELIQQYCSTKNLKTEVEKLLIDENRQAIFENYQKLRAALGQTGASERAARIITAQNA